jgi:glycosyltransferase involved in cell wall biosynthesis
MKKKVLFVPSWYPSDDDPITGIFVEEQAVTLSREFDVAVLIPEMASWRNLINPNAPDKSVKTERAGLPVYREFARPLVPHGPESVAHATYIRAAQHGFKKVAREWGTPDVIHAHSVLPGGWAAVAVGKRHDIPVVMTEHSSPYTMHFGSELRRRLVPETLKRVDRVIAVSTALAKQLLEVQPGLQVELIGELVRTSFFVPRDGVAAESRTKKRFFVAARLSKEKGLDHLIEAVHLLLDKGTNSFELVIGGDGPERQKLEQMVQTLGVGDYCRFLGALNREQVRESMQDCDVFVLSSLRETFGIVVGEAMACGKPVIATRCGGPEFIVNERNGVLVDLGSPHALAGAMEDFVADRMTFDPRAVRESVVSRFSPEAFIRNITAVYESVW